MFIRLNTNEVKGQKLKGTVNGKEIQLYVRLQANKEDFEEAVKVAKMYECVVAIDYTGGIEDLESLPSPSGVLVLITQEYAGVENIVCGNPEVRYVYDVPDDFADMATVYNVSHKFSNVYFNNGYFLNIEGCNIGAIRAEDMDRKAKNQVVTHGDASVFETIEKEAVQGLKFSGKVKDSTAGKVRVSTRVRKNVRDKTAGGKGSGRKKKVASFLEAANVSNFDNF